MLSVQFGNLEVESPMDLVLLETREADPTMKFLLIVELDDDPLMALAQFGTHEADSPMKL